MFTAVLLLDACGGGATATQSGSTPSAALDDRRGLDPPRYHRPRPVATPLGPADCDWGDGQGISLAPGEQAHFVYAADTPAADEVLPYGESVTAGVLRCESAESGITCRDVPTSHGLSISRQTYQLF
jgi:hypothetical protein